MSRQGTALYMTLGVLIAYVIFASLIKSWLFSAVWFQNATTDFPIIFYSALADFIVLIALYSFIHNIRLFKSSFNDDLTFLSGLAGILTGWFIIRILSVSLSQLYKGEIIAGGELASGPAVESTLVVFITLAMIVVSREILLRGFMFQFIARGFGESAPTWGIPLFVAIFAGRLEHYSTIEFINVFLFNVLLCYCYRMFHDLWLPATLSLSIYFSAFFMRVPVRELSFLDRPNMLTGLDKSWFGSEVTAFAGIPLTMILVFLLILLRYLVKNKKIIPLEDALDYPEAPVRRPRPRSVRDRQQWIG